MRQAREPRGYLLNDTDIDGDNLDELRTVPASPGEGLVEAAVNRLERRLIRPDDFRRQGDIHAPGSYLRTACCYQPKGCGVEEKRRGRYTK